MNHQMRSKAVASLVRDIETSEKKKPLLQQGDIVALKQLYDSLTSTPRVVRWFIFLIAWCLREPILIKVFNECVRALSYNKYDDEGNCRNIQECLTYLLPIKLPLQGRFIPPRCRQYLKPLAILKMDFASLYATAVAASIVFGAYPSQIINRELELLVLNRIMCIRGVGNCSAHHFLRYFLTRLVSHLSTNTTDLFKSKERRISLLVTKNNPAISS